ncbi:MAG: NAD(P)/FAD-dependent oxidoreductase [Pseudomonadota bacterium]
MNVDVAVIGAGAAGMMCASFAKGRTLLVDHARAPGEKIRISGGGRCNFTNLNSAAHAFLSQNPHFAKSALSSYTQWDFIGLVDQYGIPWHEKTLGQLFCDTSAKDIIAMLRDLLRKNSVDLRLQTTAHNFAKTPDGFEFTITNDSRSTAIRSRCLVIATGGKSIPKMGATGLAYDIAHQFGLGVTDTRPALVPFSFSEKQFATLSGVSTAARVTTGGASFEEAILFTHRGLSGPAVLQASSFWREGQPVVITLQPNHDFLTDLMAQRQNAGKRTMRKALSHHLPRKLVNYLADDQDFGGNLADHSNAALQKTADFLQNWRVQPSGTEGYRTAEVTLGGVDTNDLVAKTLETKTVPGLFFIGEAVDVTGWLGGYNFQWAWSSGMAAARAL